MEKHFGNITLKVTHLNCFMERKS
jgi:hypothetical protein